MRRRVAPDHPAGAEPAGDPAAVVHATGLHTVAPHAPRRGWWRPAAWAAAALLSACGGGGDDDSGTPPGALSVVPDSATASAAAYTAFTAELIGDGTRADVWTPLQMNQARAPTSEVALPATVR